MGKNRKVKQAVNQAHIDSDEDGCSGEVPAEFLTSDDFKVVQKKRHHSKKSSDELEERSTLPRSRSNSNRFTEAEEIHGCHSSFWAIRSQSISVEDGEDINPESLTIEGETCCKVDKIQVDQKKILSAGHSNGSVHASEVRSEDFSKGDCSSREIENGASNKLQMLREDKTEKGVVPEGQSSAFEEQNSEKLKISTEAQKKGDPKLVDSKSIEDTCSVECIRNEEICLPLKQNILRIEKHVVAIKDLVVNADLEPVLRDAVNGKVSNGVCAPSRNDSGEASSRPEVHTMKTSSQKKKEKKAREHQKKVNTAYSRSRTSSDNIAEKVLVSSSSSEFSESTSTNAVKKDEKTSDEAEKRDRKRPSKKQLAAIHEALRKAKEDEERQKQEDEARRRLAEEAEKQAQERLRLEQEKKEKKKLKEKQKREKMKAEGRLLSKSQKQSRARMEATLEVLRQQGIDIPQIGEKRPRGPRLGSYRTSHRKRLDSSQSDPSLVDKPERHKSESLSSQESGKESLSDLPNSFESWEVIAIERPAEPETGHASCSEESDTLDEDRHGGPGSAKEAIAKKLKESLEKSNLAKFKIQEGSSSLPEENDSVKLRSPVICVLGHVDTGKTKLLDYIRKTHVQDSEAGGITQQIGATMIPRDALKEKCKMVKDFSSLETKVPGLLVIDTPGHEAFRNLRSRGTSVCDIAILVVDIMHGLEPQTRESINLLKTGKIPFVVALNKIDRLYGWQSMKDEDIETTIKKQSASTQIEFKKRAQDVVLQFANECLNAALFYENKDARSYVSMVPTSAITGDGMGNLLSLITQLTQSLMHKKLIYSQDLRATVLEVKVISGLGTTIDVILVNGRLQEGDTIVLGGQEGPIVTQIRSILMPQSLKEMRVKNPYIEHKAVEGAQGVKITGKDLDKSVAGLPLFVASNHSKVDHLKSEISELLDQSINSIKTTERGVYVQASTLGSLEALLEYLSSSDIPYFGVKIGPVVKKDVMKASIMLEHDSQYATILAFDVKVERDAQELADNLGVKIFQANIIYHLFDEFLIHRETLLKKRNEAMHLAVFPCILKVLPDRASRNENPIILDVAVEAGSLRVGTPLCVSTKGNLELGLVSSIQMNQKSVTCAKEGDEVCIVIETKEGDLPKVFGSHFDHEDYLVSRITRQSIDVCKEYYRDDLDSTDWHLMAELKKMLHVHA